MRDEDVHADEEDGGHPQGVDVEDLRDHLSGVEVRAARGDPDGSLAWLATMAPAEAAAAKNWSSKRPRRSRATAMNHRKKSPAKGKRPRANLNRPAPVSSHAPVSWARSAMVVVMIITLAPNSTAKRIPAMAPAIGVAARRSTLAA
jgi:hypothetical protein